MRTWRVWLITIPFICLMVLAAIVVALWNNLSSNWNQETYAAEYVLNHTPLDHLEQYQVFTASGLEDVFSGKDTFNHQWYSFYIPSEKRAYSIPASRLINEKVVESNLAKLNIYTNVCHIGYVTNQASNTLKTANKVVYECQGTTKGKTTFAYVDAANGQLLWKYVL
jgi:uncharacterized protein YpmB